MSLPKPLIILCAVKRQEGEVERHVIAAVVILVVIIRAVVAAALLLLLVLLLLKLQLQQLLLLAAKHFHSYSSTHSFSNPSTSTQEGRIALSDQYCNWGSGRGLQRTHRGCSSKQVAPFRAGGEDKLCTHKGSEVNREACSRAGSPYRRIYVHRNIVGTLN